MRSLPATGPAFACSRSASKSCLARRRKPCSGRLHALERFAAAPEIAAPLAQLRIDLRRGRLVPELEFGAGVLEHDAQLRDQHAAELLHELRAREAQRLRETEVLRVAGFDFTQLDSEAGQVGRLRHREAEAEFAVELAERSAEHVADFIAVLLRAVERAVQPRAERDEGFLRAEVEQRGVHL
jgi:hypothetical protein